MLIFQVSYCQFLVFGLSKKVSSNNANQKNLTRYIFYTSHPRATQKPLVGVHQERVGVQRHLVGAHQERVGTQKSLVGIEKH